VLNEDLSDTSPSKDFTLFNLIFIAFHNNQCSSSAGTLAADAAAQAAGPPEACAAGDFFEARAVEKKRRQINFS
jgi:hypothetical protein